MKTIIKWLLYYGSDNALMIEEKHLSIYVPMNRYLDGVGNYHVEGVEVKGNTYICVYDPTENTHEQSKVLVMKAGERGPIDLKDEDTPHMDLIAKRYLKHRSKPLQ